jgi:hypothetical protein
MHEILFEDRTTDISQSEKYSLSIQINLDGFSALLLNNSTNKPVYLSHSQFRLTSEANLSRKVIELIKNQYFDDLTFNSVTIIIGTRDVRLMPEYLSNESSCSSLFYQDQKNPGSKTYLQSPYIGPYHQLFSIRTDLKKYFDNKFPGSSYIHETLPLTNGINTSNYKTVTLFCITYSNYIHIFAKQGLKITYFNSFDYESANDILFYLLTVLKLFEGQEVNLYLSGQKIVTTPIAEMIKTHLPHIVLRTPENDSYSWAEQFNKNIHEILPILMYNFA